MTTTTGCDILLGTCSHLVTFQGRQSLSMFHVRHPTFLLFHLATIWEEGIVESTSQCSRSESENANGCRSCGIHSYDFREVSFFEQLLGSYGWVEGRFGDCWGWGNTELLLQWLEMWSLHFQPFLFSPAGKICATYFNAPGTAQNSTMAQMSGGYDKIDTGQVQESLWTLCSTKIIGICW